MKDQGAKDLEDVSKINVKEEHLEKVNNIEETDSTTAAILSSEPTENDDIDDLVNDVKELNIKPGDEDKMIERGPTGGVARQCYTDKTLPINAFGNYTHTQGFNQQPNDNGRRDLEYGLQDHPRKYIRPAQQPQQHQFYQQNTHGGFAFNNLNAPRENLPFNLDFQKQVFHSNPLTNSGGKVIVQSPPAFSLADELLDQLSCMDSQTVTHHQDGQYPGDMTPLYPMTTMGNCEENVLSPTPSVGSVNMRSPVNARRPSDPSDSGLESAEEKSPYSDVAPSPTGSNYSCPPSVESGYGRSPQHEPMFGQTNVPMSSPNYPGITSPGPNRVTPSPASTAGYNSPMQQTHTDQFSNEKKIYSMQTEEFFDDPKNQDLLEDALDVISKDLNGDSNGKSWVPVSQFPVQNTLPGNCVRNPPISQPPIVYQPQGMPLPKAPAAVTTQIPANILPTTITTTAAPGSFIIVQNGLAVPNSVPVILVNPIPKKEPAKQKPTPRKILPKTSTNLGSSTMSVQNNAGVVTTTSPSKRTPNIMASREGGPALNRIGHQTSTAQAQQNQNMLMIARRTVAEMTSEELKKSDDEGDTYLHIAVCKTDKHMVQALLERLRRENLDHLVDQENNKRQTPLYLAVYINQPVMVAMFIKFQANVNVLAQSLSSDGMTREVKAAIHVAASQGQEYLDTLQQLLNAKDISINIVNNYGQTALHCAISAHNRMKKNSEARINSTAIIKQLIKAGADASAQDQKSGKTPLMYAIEQRDYILVETILSCIEPSKMRNVVRTQAFDGSSCLKIAEGLKESYNVQAWNKLWNSLQSAATGSMRMQPSVF